MFIAEIRPMDTSAKNKIRKKLGGICQRCDCQTKKNQYNNYLLEIHHLVPRGKFTLFKGKSNKNIKIDNPKNLVGLCSNCHNEIHNGSKRVKQSVLKDLKPSISKDFDEVFGNGFFDKLIQFYK